MAELDRYTLMRRDEIASFLSGIVPGEGVIRDPAALRVYDCDGLTARREVPMLVVLPETSEQVSEVLRYCLREKIKLVARGAGTSLSGGALPLADGIVLGLSRLNKILDIDLANRCMRVQSGVTNLAISQAVEKDGFFYAPDPSSRVVCTIGGNVAENAGGVHCLKYGLTVNNLLGLQAVLVDGSLIELGGKTFESVHGYDLLGLLTGSEGLLAVVTEVVVRLRAKPLFKRTLMVEFSLLADAGRMVAGVMMAGIIPAGMEMMDRTAIRAVEEFARAGYSLTAEAMVLIELDGHPVEVEVLTDRVRRFAAEHHATRFLVVDEEEEAVKLWAGRDSAFAALGRLAPDYYCVDGTIPRGRIAEALERIGELSRRYGLTVANIFPVGAGNLHPLILYDSGREGQWDRVEALSEEILGLCVELGGLLTGEHGIGTEKHDLVSLIFDREDVLHQRYIKRAFDPHYLLNPGKMFPGLGLLGGLGRLGAIDSPSPFAFLEHS